MFEIKNLLFDFGGVILNLDYNLTTEAFKKLGYNNFNELFSQYKISELFEKLETGHVSEDTFFAVMSSLVKPTPSHEDILEAWNAMLISYRLESLKFLEELAPHYNLYLLSNTNIIHKRAFDKMLEDESSYNSLSAFFTKAYYSHLVGLRKPYNDIYNFVLNDAGIKPEETLFIDDSVNNIETAKKLNFKTDLLLPGELIEVKLAYLLS